MTFELVATLPVAADDLWTEQAVTGLVGQRPRIHGKPGEVIAAWKDIDGNVVVRLRVDHDPAPFTLDLLDGDDAGRC